MRTKKTGPFIVVFDDNQGVCAPMTWDTECDGALCCASVASGDTIAFFATRKQARTAIDISAKWNLLLKTQGKPSSDDFTRQFKKMLYVVPLRSQKE